MSDYETLEVGLNDLGKYEAEQEVSGYDAVTTTQHGLQKDEFMKDSGLSIDMVGDAKKATEVEEKEKKKVADLRDDFFRAQADLNKQEYAFKMDGEDFNISHGELKDIVQDTMVDLKDKMINGKTPEERAQAALDYKRFEEIKARMDKGKATKDDVKYMIDDFAKRDDDFKDRIKNESKPIENKFTGDAESKIIARREAYVDNPSKTVANDFNAQSSEIEGDFGESPVLVQVSSMESSDIESDFGSFISPEDEGLINDDFGGLIVAQSNHSSGVSNDIDKPQGAQPSDSLVPKEIKVGEFGMS